MSLANMSLTSLEEPQDIEEEHPQTRCAVCLSDEDARGICTYKGCPARRIKLKLWNLQQQKNKGQPHVK